MSLAQKNFPAPISELFSGPFIGLFIKMSKFLPWGLSCILEDMKKETAWVDKIWAQRTLQIKRAETCC